MGLRDGGSEYGRPGRDRKRAERKGLIFFQQTYAASQQHLSPSRRRWWNFQVSGGLA